MILDLHMKRTMVYDPYQSLILQDFVKVLETNTQPNSNNALANRNHKYWARQLK
jgi:hypothetical protein